MTTAELDALVLRANRAGFNSIAEYAQHLVDGLRIIADAESGVWGRIARDTLDGGRIARDTLRGKEAR